MKLDKKAKEVLEVLGIDKEEISKEKFEKLKGKIERFDEETIQYVRNNPQEFFSPMVSMEL